MFARIVMAIDGSGPARKAIPVAVDLATGSGGEVFVIHVHQKELTSRETTDVETLDEARMLGALGHGYFSELLLGSVAHKVLRLATCTVVIAR